jgi:serine/threonine protein kinase
LKPENILISYEGHFKLTDFGISEVGGNQNKYAISMNNFENNFKNFSINTKTILGTEHYLAPEVLKNEIITSQVDYWSLGVLIFELFTNTLPFYSEKFSSINDNILNLKINWEPFDLLPGDKFFNKSEAKDLINKFLNLDPNIRWGYRDLVLIKKHAFFKQFDWDNIKNVNDVIIKKHVLSQINAMNEKIKKGNQTTITQGTKNELNLIKNQNIDDTLLLNKNNSLDDPNDTLINENDLLNSERVDNLYLICQDVIKINFKHKTFKRETESNFLDMLNELNN